MYRRPVSKSSDLSLYETEVGQTLEQKIERALNNKEPLDGDAPLLYTERAEGVNAGMNIRTDRFDVALEGMDKVNKSRKARRDSKAKLEIVKDVEEGTQEAKAE